MATSHRKPSRLPAIGRRAAACAAAAPLAMLIGGGVAAADTGNTGGQDALCHENTVCAPVNVGVNAPDLLRDGIEILDATHGHGHH